MKELNDVGFPPGILFLKQETVRAHKRERVIKKPVDRIFSSLAASCPDLTVVVLKVNGILEMSEDTGTHPFLRSKQIDLYGQTRVVGMAEELHMVKHHEPCSEILEPNSFGFHSKYWA
jgi:hypothetical protein